jgi:caffeoyl-CoA O-methyltransferase
MKAPAALLMLFLLLAPARLCLAADVDDLKAAQEQFEAAFKTRDVAAIAGSLAPGYTEFPIDSDVPADWSAKTADQRRQYFTELLSRYESWEVRLEDMQYRVAGATGVASGTERLARKPKAGVLEYPRLRFTAVWIKAEGRWRMLTCHRSAMPATAPIARPLAADDAEALILKTALDTPRFANVPLPDARLLRVLAEASGARRAVELGTSTGYSGLWICAALRRTGGTLTTFEIDPQRAAIAREQFRRAGVADLVTVVEGDAHENIKRLKGPIDFVFIDAEKPGYAEYLRKLLPLVRPGGLILAHNMRWPSPNQEYVEAVTTNPALETIFVDMDDQGVGVTLKKR